MPDQTTNTEPPTYDLGTCPFVVVTAEDAERAGQWAQAEAERAMLDTQGPPPMPDQAPDA